MVWQPEVIDNAEQSTLGQIFEFFHPGTWDWVRTDCAALNGSLDIITQPKLGATYIGSMLLYEIIYIPCLCIITKKEFFQHACYKIMFSLGIMDIISLFPNALFAGYYLIVGGSVCTYPLSNLIGGQLAFALWCGYCSGCLLLGFNRSMDFGSPRTAEVLFQGHRIWIWIFVPVLYVLYVFLHEGSCVFHPYLAGYFFDIDPFKAVTTNLLHAVNNFGVTTISFIQNSVMILLLVRLFKRSSLGVSTMQKVIVIQCVTICTIMMIASAIYVFMQFAKLPMIFTVISTMMWQFSNGAPGIMYIVVNRSIRNELLTRMGLKKKKGEAASTSKVAPAATTKTTEAAA